MFLTLLSACAPVDDTAKPADTDTTDTDTTDTAPVDTLDADAIATIEAETKRVFRASDATGCSVAVWRDGVVIWAGGFGTRDEAGDPVTADTLFQIGSDTKKMTAISLLKHVEDGTIGLDDPLSALLPDLTLAQAPGYPDTVTLRQLLSHQSGLFDYTRWTETPDDAELAGITYGRFAGHEYAMMPAGIAWNYSNPNYSLAGLLDEELSGAAWPDLVEDNVARPLGMTHTWARRDELVAAETDIASGYGPIFSAPLDSFDLLEEPPAYTVGWILPEDQPDDAFTRPAGLVWATASDVARLQVFLVDGDDDVLSDALREELQTGQVPLYPNLDPTEYGYGFGIFRYPGFVDADGGFRAVPTREHGGNTITMTSAFRYLPEQRVGVSVLANAQGLDLDGVAAAALVAAAADRLPAATETPNPFEAPAADLTPYAGDFEDEVFGEATLTVEDGELHVSVPMLDTLGASYESVLTPYAKEVFLLTVEGAGYDLSFYPAADGTPASHAVNRSFVFNRVMSGRHARPGRLTDHAALVRHLALTQALPGPHLPPGPPLAARVR